MKKKQRHSIFFRMLVDYVICNMVLLIIFGVAMMTNFSYGMKSEVKRYNEIILEQMRYRFDSIYDNIISSMVQFSSFDEISSALSNRNMTGVEKMYLDRAINRYLKKTESAIVSDIMVVGLNGYSYSYMAKDGLNTEYDFQNSAWFQKAVDDEGRNQYIHTLGLHRQDFYNKKAFAKSAAQDTFSISFALTDLNHRVVGALIYHFDLEKMAELLNSNKYEKDYRLALVDENGVITSINEGGLTGQKFELDEESWEKLQETAGGTMITNYHGQKTMINYQTTNMGWKLVSTVPMASIDAHSNPIQILFIVLLISCLVINGLVVVRISTSLHKPIASLVENVQKIDFEYLQVKQEEYEYDEMNLIQEKFNDALLRLDNYIRKDLKSQILLNKFHLNSLQSQINPHFLMNTLQLLQTEIVCGDINQSNEIIVSLSRMLNYSLYDKASMVSIRKEMTYIRSYLNLFRMKYEDRLSLKYQVQEEIQDNYMPKLLLQPVVENCIKHAFNENPDHAMIMIDVVREKENIVFLVQDNGEGMNPATLEKLEKKMKEIDIDSSEIGLKNVHQRIQVMFGTDYGVKISSCYGEGTEVCMIIPRISAKDLGQYEEKIDEIINC